MRLNITCQELNKCLHLAAVIISETTPPSHFTTSDKELSGIFLHTCKIDKRFPKIGTGYNNSVIRLL